MIDGILRHARKDFLSASINDELLLLESKTAFFIAHRCNENSALPVYTAYKPAPLSFPKDVALICPYCKNKINIPLRELMIAKNLLDIAR